MTTTSQVLAPLFLAANIATLGLSAPETSAAGKSVETLSVGGKTMTSSTKTGKALITAVKKLQSVKPAGLAEGASITRRIYAAKLGTNLKTVMTAAKIAKAAYQAQSDFRAAFASEFASQTSPDINAAIDRHFIPKTAQFLKETWGMQQLAEMSEANGWSIAQDTLNVVSIVDITGVSGVVQAYAQPICQTVEPFPCTSATINDPTCVYAAPSSSAEAGGFTKHGNNGTVSCATYCGRSEWSGGVGTCRSAKRNDTQQNISCDTAPGLLAATRELTCECATRAPFTKHGNNGTVSCDTYCNGSQWAGGTGMCSSSTRSDTSAALGCASVPGLLPAGKELTCQCMALPFTKHGNNGTVSCDTYCNGSQWAGGTGSCSGALRSDTSQALACSGVPGLLPGGKELTCQCMAR